MSKFCSNCGNQMEDQAPVCPACGAPQYRQNAPMPTRSAPPKWNVIIGFIALGVGAFILLLSLIATFQFIGLGGILGTASGSSSGFGLLSLCFGFFAASILGYIGYRELTKKDK